MNKEFTDKVMTKIAAEMILREKRRTAWITVLYAFIGVVAFGTIVALLDVFDLLPFDTWKSIFSQMIPSGHPSVTVSPDFLRSFSSVGSFFAPVSDLIHSHSIAAIITANALVLTFIAWVFGQKGYAQKQN